MKILILSWRGPGHPQAGGAELSTHEHAKAWVKAGHEVVLFTSSVLGAKSKQIINGVEVVRKGDEVFGVQIAAFFWVLFGKHPKFDLVVDQFHGIPFFTPLYVRTKKLAFIHEVTKEVWKLNPWPKPFNLIPWVVGSLFEPLIFKLFYKNIPFMTVSKSTKSDLAAWGIPKRNITVVYNGVTVVRPKPFPKKEKEKTAMFLGALSKDKGIEDEIEIFSLIDQMDAGWQFWVVGKGDKKMTEFLISNVKELDMENKVKFWGYVSNRNKFELLAKAHVMVNTSIREGWGLVNIEASSMGTPVVGYRVPGVSDSVVNGKTGLLVKRGNLKGAAQAVIFLTRNFQRYSQMQKNAIVWSMKFKWSEAGKNSMQLIAGL